MMRLAPWLCVFGTLFVACGFPDVQFDPVEEDDGGTTSSTTSMGGSGGTPSGGGQGGTGGAEPICDINVLGQCGENMKCSWDTALGAPNCVPAGDHGEWVRCFTDADCMEGLWCDALTSVCHPLCTSSPQCAGANAGCIPGTDTQGQVPLSICTSDCNPLNANPCNDAEGKTTCYYNVGGGYWDCTQTSGLLQDTICDSVADCDRGLVCSSTDMEPSRCREWCEPVGQECDAPGCDFLNPCFCIGSNPAVEWGSTAFGVCFQN